MKKFAKINEKASFSQIAYAIVGRSSSRKPCTGEVKALFTLRVLRQLHNQSWKLGMALTFGISGAIVTGSDRAFAQIQADPTVGTLVNGSPTLLCTPNCTITGGTQAGSNLFHSFSQFSVPTGGEAFFNTNNAPIQNIISRITGSSISNIDGTLRCDSTANLFLINPNGISFGPNATLNLGGSFFASTANSVTFADGTQFSATPSLAPPLLTVSAPLGLQYGANSGNIRVTGATLAVQPGQTLALVGGSVDVNGGVLRAQGGRIELGGLTGAGTVTLEPTANGSNLRLTFPDAVARGNVTLSNKSVADVVANGGGFVVINAQDIGVSGGSFVCAGLGAGSSCETPTTTFASSTQAGNIVFNATGDVTISDSRIENNVNPGASGNSEDIFTAIDQKNYFGSIVIAGKSISLTDKAQVSTTSFGQGSAGAVIFGATGEVSVADSSIFSNMSSKQSGSAGGIIIEAPTISLNNSKLEVETSGTNGKAGIIALSAEGGSITLNNSILSSDVNSGAVGNARGIVIQAGTISTANSTQISSSTYGSGDAGAVILTADDSITLAKTRVFSNVESGGVGNGGVVTITAGSLTLDGSQVQTIIRGPDPDKGIAAGEGDAGVIKVTVGEALLTGVLDEGKPSLISSGSLGNGDAGLVLLIASGDVTFSGKGAGLRSNVEGQGVGNAGGVGVRARSLNLRNGGLISVNNASSGGEAGAILIQARDIFMFEDSAIAAVTLSGNGGDIELDLQDFLVLRRGSDISTTAGFAPGGGNGGNMKINAGYIFGLPVNDNNITAQAYQGKGGSIRIRSNRLYAINQRSDDFLNTNDITVSSTYGINGEIELNTVDIDPTAGLNNLPETAVDTSRLIAQRCNVRGKDAQEVNKFTVTGRGGIPSSPNDTLQNESVETNWVTTDPPGENGTGNGSSTNPDKSVPSATSVPKTQALVEAQGWVYGPNGEVILTAEAPTATPHNPSLIPAPASCNAN